MSTLKNGGGSINMVIWKCMAACEVGWLSFIDSILDHIEYENTLKENLKQRAQYLTFRDDFVSTGKKHTAHNIKLWLLYNIKNQLHNSP